MQELDRLLARVSTAGDMSAVLLGGSAGYAADSVLGLTTALPSAESGLLAAAFSLGLKKAYDAWQLKRSERGDVPAATVEVRAKRLVEFLRDKGDARVADRLSDVMLLHQASVVSDDQLEAAISEAVSTRGLTGPWPVDALAAPPAD